MDIFNDSTIRDMLLLAEHGDNKNDDPPEPNFIRKLLNAKISIDRWSLIMTDVLFHKAHKEYVINELQDKIVYFNNADLMIWGATLHFIDNMPKDKVLALSIDNSYDNLFGDVPSRAVAMFTI